MASFDKNNIDTRLVKKLISNQFPQFSNLEIKPVEISGWDNRMFRLGNQMVVRLPSAQRYADQVLKEQKWLPVLAKNLQTHIPEPLFLGQPDENYPWHWSIYKWIDGKSLNSVDEKTIDLNSLTIELANFLNELHKVDILGAPAAGEYNFYRGGDLSVYDQETKNAISNLKDIIDEQAALNTWKKALESKWTKQPVWIHGDLSVGNILFKQDRLCAVIDFGGTAVGDPACDLVIYWNFLEKDSQKIFKERLNLDSDTWSRAKGWALWKTLITLNDFKNKNSTEAQDQMKILDKIINF